MKILIKRAVLTLTSFLLVFALFSCKTAPKEEIVDPNFLGDYAPIELENLMGVSYGDSKIKPLEIKAYFVPRNNNVELYFRLGINKIALVLNQKTRESLLSSIYAYLEDYQEDRLRSTYTPTKENAYAVSEISLSWGLLGPSYTATKAEYRTNYKNLNKKPYFYIYIKPSPDTEKEHYSPKLEFYFSPSQLEAVVEALDQENLEVYIEELNKKAFEF